MNLFSMLVVLVELLSPNSKWLSQGEALNLELSLLFAAICEGPKAVPMDFQKQELMFLDSCTHLRGILHTIVVDLAWNVPFLHRTSWDHPGSVRMGTL